MGFSIVDNEEDLLKTGKDLIYRNSILKRFLGGILHSFHHSSTDLLLYIRRYKKEISSHKNLELLEKPLENIDDIKELITFLFYDDRNSDTIELKSFIENFVANGKFYNSRIRMPVAYKSTRILHYNTRSLYIGFLSFIYHGLEFENELSEIDFYIDEFKQSISLRIVLKFLNRKNRRVGVVHNNLFEPKFVKYVDETEIEGVGFYYIKELIESKPGNTIKLIERNSDQCVFEILFQNNLE